MLIITKFININRIKQLTVILTLLMGGIAMRSVLSSPEPQTYAITDNDVSMKAEKILLSGNWPVWSPDGEELSFISSLSKVGDSGGPPTLWTFNLRNQTLNQPVLRYGAERTAWSPDKQLIAYESQGNIYVYDLKSKKLHPLFSEGGTGNGRYPTWGPDSRTLAFSSARNGKIDVYVAQLDLESDQIRKSYQKISLLPDHGDNRHPVWSQDGQWIAFTHELLFDREAVTQAIYIMHPDGSGLKHINNLPPHSRVERLSWGPRKDELIVNRISGGSGTVRITTKRPQNIPDRGGWLNEGGEAGPAITKYGGYYVKGADGKYLIFHFPQDKKGRYLPWKEELVVDVKTGKLKPFELPYDNQYTRYPKSATQIAPSPDGKRMAFVTESTDGQSTSLWVANIDGSNPVELETRWPFPKHDVPIVTRVGPDFPIPLIKILGDPITIDAYIFHPSGWDGIKQVTFNLSKTDDTSKVIALTYDSSSQQYTLQVGKNTVSKSVTPKSSNSATQSGITMFGKDSLVEPDKHGGKVQVSFKADTDSFIGEWDIAVEVVTISGKKYITDHVGVIKLKKQWFG